MLSSYYLLKSCIVNIPMKPKAYLSCQIAITTTVAAIKNAFGIKILIRSLFLFRLLMILSVEVSM